MLLSKRDGTARRQARAILYPCWIWNTRWSLCLLHATWCWVFFTYKMAALILTKQCLFYQLRKLPPARMPGHVYRPVRPLLLIYNSMKQTYPLTIRDCTGGFKRVRFTKFQIQCPHLSNMTMYSNMGRVKLSFSQYEQRFEQMLLK